MAKYSEGGSTSKNYKPLRLVIYLFFILIVFALSEIYARVLYGEVQPLYLPYFGLSEDQHNLLIWQHQPEKREVGTITVPYSFDLYDSKLGWKVKPKADVKHSKHGLWEVEIKTNSFGLRGKAPLEFHKPSDVIRIGIIGASQTFGESVNSDEAYVSLLNKKFNDTEVLNFGVRGYGTDQMFVYYENEAKKYNLDFTILAFAFHHIPRNIRKFTFYAKPYFVINNNNLDLLGIPVPSEFELFDKDIPKIRKSILNNSLLLRIGLKNYRAIRKQKIYSDGSEAWDTTLEIITHFSNTAKRNNSHFILLNIEHNYKELEPALIKFSNEQNIDLINLGPILRGALDSDMPIQIANDSHWSTLGHQIVANSIYENLCRMQSVLNCI